MSKHTPIYRTWLDRIESGVLTKAQCQQFCRVVNTQVLGYAPQGHRTNLTAQEAHALHDRIHERGGVLLTPEHEKQGIEWLRSRNGRKALGLPAEIVDGFHHFSFQGDAELTSNGYWVQSAPVWRIHLADGRTFDYFCNSWQSGQARSEWWETRAAA